MESFTRRSNTIVVVICSWLPEVEAANLKKAQKEMGEVTSDHTFKPKLRSTAKGTNVRGQPWQWTVPFLWRFCDIEMGTCSRLLEMAVV